MENKLQSYLSAVEETVNLIKFPSNPSELYEPMSYILRLGGKRMRPVLTLMACEAFGKELYHAKDAAMAVELFHNFSLIHDDIMDNAPLRRGQATVHEKWNNSVAILSGDGMLIEAYKFIQKYPAELSHQLLHTFNQTATEVCEGQQFDLSFEKNEHVTLEQYLEMIKLKTAVLLGCSLKMGAIVANASVEDQQHLYNFGVNLGIAFQVQDDYLDVFADQSKFGKQVGGDILANKKTYLSLTALELANDEQKKQLKALQTAAEGNSKVTSTKKLFVQLGVPERTLVGINTFYNLALENLNALHLQDDKKAPFKALAEYLLKRDS